MVIIQKNRVFQHVLFWMVYVLFHGLTYGGYNDEYGREVHIQLMELPVKIIVTYFVIYYLLPKYILPGKWLHFAIVLLLSTIAAGFLQRAMSFYLVYPIYYPDAVQYGYFWPIKILKGLIYLYPPVFLAMAIKLLKYWYVDQQDKQLLANEKLEAELKFLKTQIHPHFLFNTLNNVYALTLKKSDKAPEMVLKLSELINYMLYECNAPKVPLENEINFVKNYLEVERMRHGDNLEVSFNVMGDTNSVFIAPMLILPFLENSFKHGVNEALEKSWVSIELRVENSVLRMKIENSKSDTQQLITNGNGTGIGLKNVRRRLDLLYPEGYDLEIMNEEGLYLVNLELKLN